MYFETWRAVGDHVEDQRTDDGDWRAAFCGAFTVSGEARTPDAALMEVERQIDKLVAEWVVRPRRRVGRPRPRMTGKARRNSTSDRKRPAR